MTIWYRKISLWHKGTSLTLSVVVYFCIFCVGTILALISNDGSLPPLPTGSARLYLLGVGFLIPASWLAQYILLSHVGASTVAVAQTINFLMVAVFGFAFLGDPMGKYVLLGGLLLILGVIVALSIQSVGKHKDTLRIRYRLLLVLAASLCLAGGLMFEKLAIDSIGVSSYAFYGWMMQFIGAVILFLIFGRKEVKSLVVSFWPKAIFAGLLTATAGGLFIYSLSKGLLSSIILSGTAKVALTSFFAIWLLKERNDIKRRLLALSLAIAGLIVIFQL